MIIFFKDTKIQQGIPLPVSTCNTYKYIHKHKPNKPNLQPYVSNEYRKGDIRYCYADATKAQKLLNFKPTITLEYGLNELASWTKTHEWDTVDLFKKALKELKEKHLAS